MKNLRNYLFVSIAAMAVLLSIAPYSSAQDIAERQPPSTAELEQFRGDLSQMIRSLGNSVERMKKLPTLNRAIENVGDYSPEKNLQAQKQLGKLSYEELEKLYAGFETHFPKWREAPGAIDAIVTKLEKGQSTRKTKSKGETVDGVNVITPDVCPDISVTPSFADIAITEGFQIAADAVMEGFPTDLISILARLAPVAVRAGLKAAVR